MAQDTERPANRPAAVLTNARDPGPAPNPKDAAAAQEIALLGALIAPKERELMQYVGEAAILHWIADGWTTTRAAEALGVNRTSLTVWLLEPERAAKYKAARRISAQAIQDDASALLEREAEEGRKISSASVALANIRANHLMRLAGLRDRTQHDKYTPPEEVAPAASAPPSYIFIVGAAPKTADEHGAIIEHDGP